ncbi:hypothetical protein H483_0102285 [Dietzia sp. UCD-THP]|uniref:AAA family ATPase n=1 Tax=Dietzia sp. UCD-THP TaxID=1292020 RepID=UPI000367447D|nr:AAA family ATPase [Dietzia sp. UCD-THP]EYT65061.1 hypothetical protein H483_0102285 [Dietzia sp. UCD-THP]
MTDNPEGINPLKFIKSGKWLDERVFPPLAYAVPGMIPEGFGLLTGPPKVGKSYAVGGLGLALATGGKAFGAIPVGIPRPVLYLALEDGDRRLQARSRHLLEGKPIPEMIDFVTEVPPLLVFEVIDAWMGQHGHEKPLVILDTLGRVMPPSMPGESDYQRDYRIGVKLKKYTDRNPGSTLLVVHHTRKQAGEDWMDSTSGTNGLNGAADFTMNLSRKRNEASGMIRITGRDIKEGEYKVTVENGFWALDGDSLEKAAEAAAEAKITQPLGETSQTILDFVNAQPGPVSAADVANGTGVKDARTYLSRLYESERIARPKRGTYARLTLGVASDASVATQGGGLLDATVATVATPLDADGFNATLPRHDDEPRCPTHPQEVLGARTGKCLACVTENASRIQGEAA